ncbi:MAG TPA: type III-B CRISPR module-associated protein Cmr5 [Bacilli bacterium]|nr:type III-B CRISPR module-associated protein Cmr5 [Bacilli bacterium]
MKAVTRLDQERSRYALNTIKKRAADPKAHEYGQYIRKLPTMILMNGYGQAMAFLSGKGKDQILEDVAKWLLDRLPTKSSTNVATGERLLEEIFSHWDTRDYRRAEQETLRLLTWMKLFADAFLPEAEVARHE